MAKSPKEVFQSFNNLDHLKYIAEFRNLEPAEKTKKEIINELSSNVSSNGMHILLKNLKLKQLKALAKYCEWGKDEKLPTGKGTLAKRIHDSMEESSPKKFLDSCDSATLKEVLKEQEVDVIPDSKRECSDVIWKTAQTIGIENCLSSFSATKLKEFVNSCGLKVDSGSTDVILDCLIRQENHISTNEFDKKSDEVPSKKKPELEKGIKEVDIYHHYYCVDLVEFCNNHRLISNGSKKELVERILRYFNGTLEKKDKKKSRKRARPKKDEKSKKASEDEESEKSDSEKNKRRKKPKKKEESESEKSASEKSSEEEKKDKKSTKEKTKKDEKPKKGEKEEKEKSDKSEKGDNSKHEGEVKGKEKRETSPDDSSEEQHAKKKVKK